MINNCTFYQSVWEQAKSFVSDGEGLDVPLAIKATATFGVVMFSYLNKETIKENINFFRKNFTLMESAKLPFSFAKYWWNGWAPRFNNQHIPLPLNRRANYPSYPHPMMLGRTDDPLITRYIIKSYGLKAKDLNTLNAGMSDLSRAAMQGLIPVAKVLLENGADVNFTDDLGQTALHTAIKHNQVQFINFLSENGADVYFEDKKGISILNCACAIGTKEMLEIFLKGDADLNAVDGSGKNPIHYASQSGKLENVKFLLENGADIRAVDFEGRDALSLSSGARFSNTYDTVKFLLEKCSEASYVNKKDLSGKTPLHHAVEAKRLDVVELLLKNGADINIKDFNSLTPLESAMKKKDRPAYRDKNNDKIIELLKRETV